MLGRSPCAESGILFRGVGGGGGGGGPGPTAGKQSGQRLFCFFFHSFFYIPELILQLAEGVQWFYYRENYTFLRIQRGSRIFQGERV